MTAVTCPVCDTAIELEDAASASNAAAAPAIAAALGPPSGGALLDIHTHQAKRRNEATLDRHFRSHPPAEWVPKLTAALAAAARAEVRS